MARSSEVFKYVANTFSPTIYRKMITLDVLNSAPIASNLSEKAKTTYQELRSDLGPFFSLVQGIVGLRHIWLSNGKSDKLPRRP